MTEPPRLTEPPKPDETPKQKVLIIEDNPVNAKLLMLFLTQADFDVLHAADGRAGLDMAKQQPGICAILLDRMMPDMDGLDVLRDLKLGNAWNVPVIMLTSALSPQQIQAAKMTGAYDCLPKPYNREKIIVTLEAAIKSRRKT